MAETARKSGLTAASVALSRRKPYKLLDRDGLYLLVKTSGTRYWRMNYPLHQNQRTITFGRFPEVLLADARERLLQARRLLADGIDPVDQAKLNKMADSVAASNSFKAVLD